MTKRFLFGTTFLVLAFAVAITSARAASVTVQVGSAQGEKGSAVQVPIQLIGAPGIGAMHLEILYDARVLQPAGVERGALAGPNALIESNPNQAGRLIIGIITLDGIKGDGVLANVKFNLVGEPGMNSALNIENARAWETGTHFEVLVKTEPGQVNVLAASPPWLIIGAVIAAVALILLLLLFFLSRRRKPAPAPAPAPVSYAPPPNISPGALPEKKSDAAWTCPRCSTANRASSRFCKTCGAARP
ncbi:MAG: hypothetical protein HY741_01685 [Chloroflexi bacterium]|nr:hypothetical protein [Chloroflexota bacterium]